MIDDTPRRPGATTRRRRLGALACALASVAALAAGCGDDDGGTATTAPATAPVTAPATTTEAPATTTTEAPATTSTAPTGTALTLYFADDEGTLRAERREVAGSPEPLAAAMSALADGPRDPALLPALPPGTRVLGTRLDGDVAVVDLSGEFEKGYPPGGAAAELAVVGPVVRTAAEASGAQRVRILVDGRTPAPTGSQFDFSAPFAPGDLPGP